MLKEHLGWYEYQGKWGTYYYHEGELKAVDASVTRGVRTGMVLLSSGYGAALMTNTADFSPVNILIGAFDT